VADIDHEEVLMVAVVPSVEGFVLPDSVNEVANEMLVLSGGSRAKRARLIELRRAIEGGEYRVPAADLADALLHTSGSAN
jgi:hypothetical protein